MITDFKIDKTKKYALVLGNEVEGISDEILTDLDVCRNSTVGNETFSQCFGLWWNCNVEFLKV
jgi:hypothetical protein